MIIAYLLVLVLFQIGIMRNNLSYTGFLTKDETGIIIDFPPTDYVSDSIYLEFLYTPIGENIQVCNLFIDGIRSAWKQVSPNTQNSMEMYLTGGPHSYYITCIDFNNKFFSSEVRNIEIDYIVDEEVVFSEWHEYLKTEYKTNNCWTTDMGCHIAMNAWATQAYIRAFFATNNLEYRDLARWGLDNLVAWQATDGHFWLIPENHYYAIENSNAFDLSSDNLGTSWAGRALAEGYLVFQDPRYLDAALQAYGFIESVGTDDGSNSYYAKDVPGYKSSKFPELHRHLSDNVNIDMGDHTNFTSIYTVPACTDYSVYLDITNASNNDDNQLLRVYFDDVRDSALSLCIAMPPESLVAQYRINLL